MWKYQCKKQLLILVITFIVGAVLFGAMGYGREYINELLLEVTKDKELLQFTYLYYMIGGLLLAGIANGLMLLMYVIQRFQAPFLFILMLFLFNIVDIMIAIGILLLFPTIIVYIYGWLTIPNRGSNKALQKNNVSTIQEIERVYRLHHHYDEQFDDLAKKTASMLMKTNILIILGLASIFFVFLYVDNIYVVFLCVFLYMFLFYEISRRRSRTLQPFISLLYEKCDPQGCASAIFALSKKMHRKRKFILAQHLAQCMIYLNDPHLTVDVLVTCDQSKGNMVYAYQSLMAYAYYLLGDRSMVKHAYDETESFGAKNTKGPMRLIRQQTLDGIQTRLNMMDKNFEPALNYFENGIKTVPFEFQRVDYHYYAGLICYVEHQMYEAETHFTYVVNHGNKFHIAEKAQKFLNGMAQHEQE